MADDNPKMRYVASPTLARFHADNSYVRAVMGPVGCYTGDVEYLTPSGWRRFADGPSEFVAQYDLERERMSFVRHEQWHEFPNAVVHRVSVGDWVQTVSSEHKVLYVSDGMYEWSVPADLPNMKVSLVTAAPFGADEFKKVAISDEMLRLQAVLLLDARWGSCWATRMHASVMVEDEARLKRLSFIAEEAGVKCTARWLETEGIFSGRMPWRMDVVPTSWWMLSPDQVRTVFDMIVEWRMGGEGTFELATSDRRMVDWMQYAAFVSGWTSWFERDRGIYTIYFSHSVTSPARVPSSVDTGRQTVYCFTVPSGYLVVRQNGRVFVSGNSGKSVGCLTELILRGLRTPPCKDGVRRSRGLVGRRTYAQLKSTTINTFSEWHGKLGSWKWDSPIKWRYTQPLPDGTTMDMELLFMSLEGPVGTVRDKLKSLELTFAFLNEAAELPYEIISAIISRLTRYPRKEDLPDGVKPWFGLWMDYNPPSIRSWPYQIFEIERPKNWKLFRQPGALMLDENGNYVPNPAAENIENLTEGYDYYLNMIPGMSEPEIRALVMGEYSPDVSGKPVYPMFTTREHLAEEDLEPFGRATIIVGCDWGLNPAAVVTMMTPHGALWVMDEVVPRDIIFNDFIDNELVPLLQRKYRGYPIMIVGDPSGASGNHAWSENVYTALTSRGLAAQPAWTNDVSTRIQAVTHFLQKRKGFLLSPSCVVLREGFEGGYHYRQLSKLVGAGYADKPEKNEYSHPHDALQYAALYYYTDVVSDAKVIARKRRQRRSGHTKRPRRALV